MNKLIIRMFYDKPNSIDGDNKNDTNSNNSNSPNIKDNIGKDTQNNQSNKSNRPIETRTYGEYFKDSKSMSNRNKHYQLGQNTGIKLRENARNTGTKTKENVNKLKNKLNL
ncbi:hypothetical protein [Faecalimicrobium sp. JNUCC 81]